MKRMLTIISVAILPVTTAFAQDGPALVSVKALHIISQILPVVLILGILYFFFTKVIRRNTPQKERIHQHMDRVERQHSRIIDLLERLVAKQDESPEPPAEGD